MKHDWEYKKLGEVCDILNGCAFKSERYTDEGIRIIRITNVQKGYVADDDPKFYPKNEEKNISPYLLKEGDLLMSLTGNVGRVGLLPHNFIPAALNQRVACLRIINNNVVLPYLFHLFNSNKFENEAITYSNGIAQKNMSTEWLKKYVIPIPPLSTQQSIVSELDSLSKIIADCKETLKDYDALEQSIFYDMFGDPVKNDKGWEVKKLGEVCTFKNGVNFSKNDKGKQYKFVGVSDFLDKKELHARDLDSVLIEETVSSEYYLNEGDIVFVRSNGSKSLVGRNVLVHTEDEIVLFSGFCIRARIHDENMTPLFLLHTLKADSVKCLISNSGRGCNISNLNQKILDSINVIIPSLSLQNQFIGKISAIEQMKVETKKALLEAETLFQARMDYWFN